MSTQTIAIVAAVVVLALGGWYFFGRGAPDAPEAAAPAADAPASAPAGGAAPAAGG